MHFTTEYYKLLEPNSVRDYAVNSFRYLRYFSNLVNPVLVLSHDEGKYELVIDSPADLNLNIKEYRFTSRSKEDCFRQLEEYLLGEKPEMKAIVEERTRKLTTIANNLKYIREFPWQYVHIDQEIKDIEYNGLLNHLYLNAQWRDKLATFEAFVKSDTMRTRFMCVYGCLAQKGVWKTNMIHMGTNLLEDFNSPQMKGAMEEANAIHALISKTDWSVFQSVKLEFHD